MYEKNEKMTPIEINVESEQRVSSIHAQENFPDDKLKQTEKLLMEMKKPIFFNCCEIIFRPCSCKSTNLYLKNLLYQKALKK